MSALSNKHYSGNCKAIEEQGDQRTAGKRHLEGMYRYCQSTAGRRQSWMDTSDLWDCSLCSSRM